MSGLESYLFDLKAKLHKSKEKTVIVLIKVMSQIKEKIESKMIFS